jgi:hypothetical protein
LKEHFFLNVKGFCGEEYVYPVGKDTANQKRLFGGIPLEQSFSGGGEIPMRVQIYGKHFSRAK